MNQLHAVFGATGVLGAAVVQRLVIEGKPARAVVRNEALISNMGNSTKHIIDRLNRKY